MTRSATSPEYGIRNNLAQQKKILYRCNPYDLVGLLDAPQGAHHHNAIWSHPCSVLQTTVRVPAAKCPASTSSTLALMFFFRPMAPAKLGALASWTGRKATRPKL